MAASLHGCFEDTEMEGLSVRWLQTWIPEDAETAFAGQAAHRYGRAQISAHPEAEDCSGSTGTGFQAQSTASLKLLRFYRGWHRQFGLGQLICFRRRHDVMV